MKKRLVAFLCYILVFLSPLVIIPNVNAELAEDQNSLNSSRDNTIILHEEFSRFELPSQTFTFETTEEKPFYRIYLFNGSGTPYNVVLPNGYEVPLGSSGLYIWNTIPSVGEKSTTITSTDGSNLFGRIIIRISSEVSE